MWFYKVSSNFLAFILKAVRHKIWAVVRATNWQSVMLKTYKNLVNVHGSELNSSSLWPLSFFFKCVGLPHSHIFALKNNGYNGLLYRFCYFSETLYLLSMINLLTLTRYSSELRKSRRRHWVGVPKYAKHKVGRAFQLLVSPQVLPSRRHLSLALLHSSYSEV